MVSGEPGPRATSAMESGTQFEAPSSRPTSAEGKVLTAGRYTPAAKQRSKSTEPPRALKANMSLEDSRKGGGGTSPVRYKPRSQREDEGSPVTQLQGKRGGGGM